jgi:DNA-binding transcriptional MerR regulator
VEDERQSGWSVRHLAELAGTTVRTIHYYTSEGLLPPPHGVKRTATYSAAHLARLRVIAALREEGLSLAAIRSRLAPLTDEQVQGVVATLDAHLARGETHAVTVLGIIEAAVSREVTSDAEDAATPESASAYVQRVLGRKHEVAARQPQPSPRAVSDAGQRASGRPVAWHRFPVADGIELHLREDQYRAARGRARVIVHDLRATLQRYGLSSLNGGDDTTKS